ncbi:MAG: hypothetical protein WBA12_09005, partial [Catalinimonas sp.]
MSKTLKTSVAVGLLCSGLTLGTYKLLGFDEQRVIVREAQPAYTTLTATPGGTAAPAAATDFT